MLDNKIIIDCMNTITDFNGKVVHVCNVIESEIHIYLECTRKKGAITSYTYETILKEDYNNYLIGLRRLKINKIKERI